MNTHFPQLDRQIQVIVVKVPLCAVSKVDARLNLYSNYPEKGTGKNEKTHDIRFDPALSGSMAFETVKKLNNQFLSRSFPIKKC